MSRPRPAWLRAGTDEPFPDPRAFDRDGLVAIGGDLAPERLLRAYSSGIFPCFEPDAPPLWWSPDPRAVFDPASLHVARRLARRARQRDVRLTWNTAFREVMEQCAAERDGGDWISRAMVDAYERLHRRGSAHSLEVWRDGTLGGGLYGVQIGAFFAAESMFHRERDFSKVALVAAVRSLFAAGVTLFDAQFLTPHLRSMGARTLRRHEFLDRVAAACRVPLDLRGLRVAFD